MEIVLCQILRLKGNPLKYKSIYKRIKSNIIPHIGDKIQDSFWKEVTEYEVLDVVISNDTNECFVSLPYIEFESEDIISKQVGNAKLHNWNCDLIN